MRKVKRILALFLAVIMAASFAGCSKVPTDQDAKAYVQAVLDLMCKGEYDHSVELSDIDKENESATRDEIIQQMTDAFLEGQEVSDEVRDQYVDYWDRALKKTKYTVGDAAKTGNGEYDVTVTIEPLELFDGVKDEFQERFTDMVKEDYEKYTEMPEDELNDVIFLTMLVVLNEKLVSPTYGAPEDTVVHYGLLDKEKKLYGCSGEDGEKLGSLLFSMKGLE